MRAPKTEHPTHVKGLRAVATMELLKGLAVVAIGFGLVTLSRRDIDVEDIASGLLWVLHVGPQRRLSMIFMNAAAKLDDMNLVRVAIGAAIYSTLRFVEAYGLWRARVWAEWLALISGSIYLPLEIYEIAHRPTLAKWVILIINVLIVVYMAWLRLEAHGIASWPRPQRATEADD